MGSLDRWAAGFRNRKAQQSREAVRSPAPAAPAAAAPAAAAPPLQLPPPPPGYGYQYHPQAGYILVPIAPQQYQPPPVTRRAPGPAAQGGGGRVIPFPFKTVMLSKDDGRDPYADMIERMPEVAVRAFDEDGNIVELQPPGGDAMAGYVSPAMQRAASEASAGLAVPINLHGPVPVAPFGPAAHGGGGGRGPLGSEPLPPAPEGLEPSTQPGAPDDGDASA